MKRLLAISILVPGLVQANPYKESLTDAAESLEDALFAARRAGGKCKSTLIGSLKKAIDDVDSVRRGTTEQRFNEIQVFVNGLHSSSPRAGCPQQVADRLGGAVNALTSAHSVLEGRDERRERRQRQDEDDGEGPPPGTGPAPAGGVEVSMGALRVTPNQPYEGEPAVRVDVASLAMRGTGQSSFYFGGRYRAQGGQWSAWVTSTPFATPRDTYVGSDVHSFWFPVRALRAVDTANGRFVIKVSLFDAARRELAFKEVPVELAPPPVAVAVAAPPPRLVAPPPPAQAPPPPPVARDCGTGPDAGCGMQRRGQYPMDREVFTGFLQALGGNSSDLTRAEMCKSVLGNNWLTAKQLGLILDLFNSDLIRLDVARLAAPHTVNPQHALGLTSKFSSSILQRDFTQLMSEQR